MPKTSTDFDLADYAPVADRKRVSIVVLEERTSGASGRFNSEIFSRIRPTWAQPLARLKATIF